MQTTRALITAYLETAPSQDRIELLAERLAYELPPRIVEEIIAGVETSAVERSDTKFLQALLR